MLCWVTSFFSADAQKDLGVLVILEHILTGERFGQYANHLSPQDRQGAKSMCGDVGLQLGNANRVDRGGSLQDSLNVVQVDTFGEEGVI
jgi:hypothetical protein